MPYGNRSREVIYRYSSEDLRFLRDKGVKFIVAACGTASSVIDAALIRQLPVPYTGVIEPTARAAAAATKNKKVGIIGTAATIKSGSFVRALAAIDPAIETRGQGCPLLVPLWKTATSTLKTRSPGWCWRSICAGSTALRWIPSSSAAPTTRC